MSNSLIYKFKRVIKKVGYKLAGEIENEIWLKSYSQAGEDKVIDFIFQYFTNTDRSGIRYVDIGMNYPVDSNNTYYFYKRGGSGICIEPNKLLCEDAKRIRPRDVIIHAGVKFDIRNEARYFCFDDCGLNTFDISRVDEIKVNHQLVDSYNVALIDINEIFTARFDGDLDLLSIDAEGVDFLILNSIDFSKCRPKIICVESNKFNYNAGEVNKQLLLMESNNYILMADTSINYIFLDRDYLILKKY